MRITLRRACAIATATFLALVGLQFLTSGAASAHELDITGKAECANGSGYTVTWSVYNNYTTGETWSENSHSPSSSTLSSTTGDLGPNATGTIVQTGIDASATSAGLDLHGKWSDLEADFTGSVDLGGVCPSSPPSKTPKAPSGADGTCAHPAPAITIPDDDGVEYKLDGSTRPAGSYPVSPGTHTVTASSTKYTLTPPTSFGFDLTTPSGCLASVTPVKPAVSGGTCTGGSVPTAPTLTLPTTAGITYSAAPRGPYTAGQTVTVSAIASQGYSFDTSPPAGWTYVDSTHETAVVQLPAAQTCAQPVTPGFSDAHCVGPTPTTGSYTVPSTPGVDYYVHGHRVPAGTYPVPAGTQITVTARPQPGFQLTGDRSFTHAFGSAPNCHVTVVPAGVSFHDDVCQPSGARGATFTVPASKGVDYLVDGAVTSAGTYQADDRSTVTVTARAQDGYRLHGRSSWRHHFPAAPLACRGTEGAHGHRGSGAGSNGLHNGPQGGGAGSGGLASTGAPVSKLLLGAVALLVAGVASLLLSTAFGAAGSAAGARRRPAHRRRRGAISPNPLMTVVADRASSLRSVRSELPRRARHRAPATRPRAAVPATRLAIDIALRYRATAARISPPPSTAAG